MKRRDFLKGVAIVAAATAAPFAMDLIPDEKSRTLLQAPTADGTTWQRLVGVYVYNIGERLHSWRLDRGDINGPALFEFFVDRGGAYRWIAPLGMPVYLNPGYQVWYNDSLPWQLTFHDDHGIYMRNYRQEYVRASLT